MRANRKHQLANLSVRFASFQTNSLKAKEHKMRMVGPGEVELPHQIKALAQGCVRNCPIERRGGILMVDPPCRRRNRLTTNPATLAPRTKELPHQVARRSRRRTLRTAGFRSGTRGRLRPAARRIPRKTGGPAHSGLHGSNGRLSIRMVTRCTPSPQSAWCHVARAFKSHR